MTKKSLTSRTRKNNARWIDAVDVSADEADAPDPACERVMNALSLVLVVTRYILAPTIEDNAARATAAASRLSRVHIADLLAARDLIDVDGSARRLKAALARDPTDGEAELVVAQSMFDFATEMMKIVNDEIADRQRLITEVGHETGRN